MGRSSKPDAAKASSKSAGLMVENWPVAKLIPYAQNPRRNDHVVGQMAEAIQEFGFKIPILARADGTIVDGHLRLKAAAALKLDRVPVIRCDEWTDAQVKAFRLLANRSATWADWDEELLAVELEDLQKLDFDLKLTGFGEDEITKYLNGIDTDAPDGFTSYDETIETEHTCPKCGYRWSGKFSASRTEIKQ